MRRHLRKAPCDVYRVYDKHGLLLYVGMSSNAFSRVEQHRSEGWRWTYAADFYTVTRYANRRAAAHIEARAIDQESPIWNKSLSRIALECVGGLNLSPIEESGPYHFPRRKEG